jgi:4-hydroxy-2-oxoglutarate aldolase
VGQPRLDLSGIFPPIPTPFDASGSIDFDRLSQNLTRWESEPLAGLVVGGSNGEFPLLTVEERLEVVRHVRRMAPGRLLIAGSGMQSTAGTIALSEAMAQAGAEAVIVVTPGYYKGRMNAAALTAHYTSVADRSPVPVLIYNVPANTGVDLPAEVAIELSQHPGILGIKDSSGDVAKLTRMVAQSADGFQVLAGSAGFFLPALAVGAVGVIAALANIASAELAEVMRRYEAGDLAGAQAGQARLMEANAAVTSRFGVAGLKCAMDLTGCYGGPPRMPLQRLTDDERRQVRLALDHSGIALAG